MVAKLGILSLLLLGAACSAERFCGFGYPRYLGPSEEDGEEFGVPDVVTSSVRLQRSDGSDASPNDLLVAGRRVTVNQEDWASSGGKASFVFSIYGEGDEVTAIKTVRLRADNTEDVSMFIGDDRSNLRKIGKVEGRLSLEDNGCSRWCNGEAGRFTKLEVRGGHKAPTINSLSILVCEAFKGARWPTVIQNCAKYSLKSTNDLQISTNVKLSSGSPSELLSGGEPLVFDNEDWQTKKDDAYLEFSLKASDVMLQVVVVQTKGVKSATLFLKDDENSPYVKTARARYQWWELGVAFDLTWYKNQGCSGISGRYFKLQLEAEEGVTPVVSKAYLRVVKPRA